MHSIAMSANVRNVTGSRLTTPRSTARSSQESSRFVQLSHLHKLRECEQVAAICYRVRGSEIEILLVRTRGSGRWTFPKGSAEPGLTHAQAAALEAVEEAGVHGRIEETSFARYICRRRVDARKSVERSAGGLAVNAHLCEVLRLGKPKESNRNRTWFSVKDARRRLREGRESQDGAEFTRVVDKAVVRIKRFNCETKPAGNRPEQDRKDALQKVQFEAPVPAEAASFIPYMRRRVVDVARSSTARDAQRREPLQCEVLQFSPEGPRKAPALGNGNR